MIRKTRAGPEYAVAKFILLFVSILPVAGAQESSLEKVIGGLEEYLNMAGAQHAKDFRPLTQHERARLYWRGLINPWSVVKATASGGIDHAHTKPQEWGQGWGAYGKRVANIEGQYAVQKTVSYLIAAPLHEDNRYFGSGKRGFWPRMQYALIASVSARHDNGKLYFSVSQFGGVAAGAFVSRLWLPPSESSASDAAISFGITTASNSGVSIVKEFLPDLFRAIGRKKKTPQSPAAAQSGR